MRAVPGSRFQYGPVSFQLFGEFVRQEGKVGGRQILPPELLAELFKGTPANPAYGMTGG